MFPLVKTLKAFQSQHVPDIAKYEFIEKILNTDNKPKLFTQTVNQFCAVRPLPPSKSTF